MRKLVLIVMVAMFAISVQAVKVKRVTGWTYTVCTSTSSSYERVKKKHDKAFIKIYSNVYKVKNIYRTARHDIGKFKTYATEDYTKIFFNVRERFIYGTKLEAITAMKKERKKLKKNNYVKTVNFVDEYDSKKEDK